LDNQSGGIDSMVSSHIQRAIIAAAAFFRGFRTDRYTTKALYV